MKGFLNDKHRTGGDTSNSQQRTSTLVELPSKEPQTFGRSHLQLSGILGFQPTSVLLPLVKASYLNTTQSYKLHKCSESQRIEKGS
jgi:hypothetical protein